MKIVLASACRALATLGYDLTKIGPIEQFVERVENVDLSQVSELKSGPVLFAALAVEVYSDDLLYFVSPPIPYLAAATAVELDAEDAEWGRFVRKRRLIGKIAEIVELMIIDLNPNAQNGGVS